MAKLAITDKLSMRAKFKSDNLIEIVILNHLTNEIFVKLITLSEFKCLDEVSEKTNIGQGGNKDD